MQGLISVWASHITLTSHSLGIHMAEMEKRNFSLLGKCLTPSWQQEGPMATHHSCTRERTKDWVVKETEQRTQARQELARQVGLSPLQV